MNPRVTALKAILSESSIQEQFQNALREYSGAFIASIVEVFSSDNNLQNCDPKLVVIECLKAATLRLPINRQLGFAWIIPYKNAPVFQLGYKGYIQLAMRTGQYRYLNADIVYTGISVHREYLTGDVRLEGEPISDKAIGYFTYMQLVNGFTKTKYMTVEEVRRHAERYSPSYHKETSLWKTDFDAMALKTTTRQLLSHYGILSPEMLGAIEADRDPEAELEQDKALFANQEEIALPAASVAETEVKGY